MNARRPGRGFALAALLCVSPSLALAQDQKAAQQKAAQQKAAQQKAAQQKTRDQVVVFCQDEKDSPVKDAEVYLYQRRSLPDGRGDYRAFGPYRSDARGEVRCPTALTYGGNQYARLAYARIPGRLVGGCLDFGSGTKTSRGSVLHVRMVPSRTLPGVVKVPKSLKADGVRVRVLSMYALDGKQKGYGTLLLRNGEVFRGLERALPEIFECDVAADGTFTLKDVPKAARVYLACEGPGLAHTQWANLYSGPQPGKPRGGFFPLPKQIEISMGAEAVLSGQMEGPVGTPLKDAAVWVRLNGGGKRVYSLQRFQTKTDAKGRFRIGGLPDAEFDLHVVPAQKEWVARPRKLKKLAVGQHKKGVVVEVVRPIEVKGIVSGPKGPVELATVIALTDDEYGPIRMDYCNTDNKGRFTLRLPPGGTKIYFGGIPNGYAFPEPQIVEELMLDAKRPPKLLRFWLKRKDG